MFRCFVLQHLISLKFLYKRSEAVFHSLVVLVFHTLKSLMKLSCEVEFFTLWLQHHGRQLAIYFPIYLPMLVGQCLDAAVTHVHSTVLVSWVLNRSGCFHLSQNSLSYDNWPQGPWIVIGGSIFQIAKHEYFYFVILLSSSSSHITQKP